MSILMLAAKRNTQLQITVEGEDAEETMEKLTHIFETRFGECQLPAPKGTGLKKSHVDQPKSPEGLR